MFKKITAATIVLSGLALSGSVHAAEVSLEQYVGSLVNQAVESTRNEISNEVQEAVLTMNNAISFESEEVLYATKVTITDLESEAAINEDDSDSAE